MEFKYENSGSGKKIKFGFPVSIGLFGLLAVLKLAGIINWSWILVVCIPIAVTVILTIAMFVIMAIMMHSTEKKNK